MKLDYRICFRLILVHYLSKLKAFDERFPTVKLSIEVLHIQFALQDTVNLINLLLNCRGKGHCRLIKSSVGYCKRTQVFASKHVSALLWEARSFGCVTIWLYWFGIEVKEVSVIELHLNLLQLYYHHRYKFICERLHICYLLQILERLATLRFWWEK